MTDNELRLLMADSVQKCHRAVFDKYCNYVYTISLSVLKSCGNREDVEECVSDVFMKIYKHLDNNTDFSDNIKGFIGAVARNTAIDAFRRISTRNSRTAYVDENTINDLKSSDDITENTERKEQSRIILDKIKELGDPDSTIIIQQYYYNRTAKEIAKSISMSAAAVQKRSSRAKQKLRILLTEAGITKEGLI
ncbi:sigma-70 family RNA polymerase sigma factor [Ruminococcus sp.]|uniref:RNA polymerase sigma factor n=1 Tax=Ruminococcus sp. TaxID=41978 RepID=UPI0025EAF437|nr:sigma-70 family RNA polymerase sigma factor [Ruminococcus sp.]MCR4638544.1 sigma-70 family RNA polymerase sigma factor [Ruminococcus sp.]